MKIKIEFSKTEKNKISRVMKKMTKEYGEIIECDMEDVNIFDINTSGKLGNVESNILPDGTATIEISMKTGFVNSLLDLVQTFSIQVITFCKKLGDLLEKWV